MKIKARIYILLCYLCSLFMFFPSFFCITTQAAVKETKEMTDVRVGLKQQYSNISSITIQTKQLGIGYCIQNQYVVDIELNSSSGFTFTPARGCYYILNKTYQGYEAAKKVADTLEGLGVNAFPTAIYRNYWKVYIEVGDKKNAATIEDKISGRFGFTYTFTQDNGHRIQVKADSFQFLIDAEKKQAYPQFKPLTKNKNGVAVLDLGNKQYRGRLEIGRYGNASLTAVNILYIESYLYGVVSSEIPSSWHKEAQKAQAVCARSFALTKTKYSADSNISSPYQLDDTTSSQVYGGYTAETSTARQAVDATAGEVILYQNKVIPAYFFSTSGGRTEDASNVWGGNVPYLKGVADSYEYSPEKEPWIVTHTKSSLSSKLSNYRLGVGTITNIYPAITTASGRVYQLRVIGSSGTSAVQAGAIREVLGLYSTKFKIIEYGDTPDLVNICSASGNRQVQIGESYLLSASGVAKAPTLSQYIVQGKNNLNNYPSEAPKDRSTYYFAGMGYGHGVGMSQSGALGMAKAGFRYQKILEYYYTGCKVGKVNS